MSNELIPFEAGSTGVPAHLASVWGEESNIASRVSINTMSYRGKIWRLIVDGEETKQTRINAEGDREDVAIIEVVVLDHNKGRSRAYYPGAYEEGKNSAPMCYSADGVTPDADVKEPCATTCASCEFSVKGSKISTDGKPSKSAACAPFKRVAIVPPGKLIGTHPALLLRLAQTSVWDATNQANEAEGWYAWDQYLEMLRQRGAKHTAAVQTRVKFDNNTAYPKLLFKAGGWLSPDDMLTAKQRIADSTDEIAKILTGSPDNDGLTGKPSIPSRAADAGSTVAKGTADVDDADVAAAEAQIAAANAKKATAAAAKKAKAEADAAAAAAQAILDAKAAKKAALLAQMAALEEDGDAAVLAPAAKEVVVARAAPAEVVDAKPAAAAAAVNVPAETGTPAALSTLLDEWHDAP